ncbi:hypothetical protein HanRHA438_Chr00c07g0846851 [Helianthus annuus]|nr:hypothetical protein HanRHA438_Chr00c07g0846851 [Helianthus annuus]
MDESAVESKLIDNGNQEKGGEKVEDEDDESKKLLLPNKVESGLCFEREKR